MNKEILVKDFKKAVIDMRENHSRETYYWYLHTDENNNDWAIVLGWQDTYGEEEENETDDCLYDGCRLSIKLAYQPRNSIMQEYDIDWIMPYDEKSGEVDDNEISIYSDTDLEDTIDWLLECYESYKDC